MSIESDIGNLTAKFLETIEGIYPDEASVNAAALVVAVDKGDGTTVYHHSFGPGRVATHEGLGLLANASHNVRRLADRSND